MPELFAGLSQPSWFMRRRQQAERWMSRQSSSRSRRQAVRVPVRVSHPGGTFVVTARDLSETGVSVTAPFALAVGTEISLSMFVPGHEWHGAVSVARCVARPSRKGFDSWVLGLRFEREQLSADIESFRQWDAA